MFEPAAVPRIPEGPEGKLAAIDRPIRRRGVREGPRDGAGDGRTFAQQPVGGLVGGEDARSRAAELVEGQAFSGGDAAGEARDERSSHDDLVLRE